MHGTFPIILRWSQGDQSQADATPANGKIEIAILGVNGTNVETSVTGPLSYTSGDVNQITIGNNIFKWDSESLWYNVTLSAEGYTLVLDTYSAILDTFHPNVEQYNGLLSSHGPALYGSVPVTRGQSVGYLTTPDKQNITVSGLVLLKHSFSQQALPSYVTKLSSAMIWGYSTQYYDSNFFYQVEQVDGTVHEATYLSRAIAGSVVKSDFPSTWGLYAVTDDPSAYTLVIDPIGATIVSTLPGCSLSNDASYLFSMAVGNVITEFTDLGGGKTTYYNVSQGFTLASYDGGLVNGTIAGMYQVYEAPLLNDS